MSGIDKNQAVINYFLQCPSIFDSPLYFNFINAGDNTNQFVTQATERYANTKYIDGSVAKIYTFILIIHKSTADIPLVKLEGYPNENMADMSDVQSLIDWIKEQDDLHNYPDFGEDCIVDSIETTTDNPSFDGINEETSPPLAVYSVTVEIRYLDISKRLWRN